MSILMLLLSFPVLAGVPLLRPVIDPNAPIRAAIVVALDGQIGGSGNLTGAENDAMELARTLSEGGFHWVLPLLGPEVTASGLEAAFTDLRRQGLRRADTALVYVITHGAVCPASSTPETQHLRLVETTEGSHCWEHSWTDQMFLSRLKESNAGNRVLVLDACLTAYGAAGAVSLDEDAWHRSHEEEVVLRSTSAGLNAFQVAGHVLYTRMFAHGLTNGTADLDGNGAITVSEVHDYAVDQLRGFRVDQVPMRREIIVGTKEGIVLAGEAGRPTRPVLDGLTPRGDWSIGGSFNALGPGGVVPPVSDGNQLVRRTGDRVVLRVHGVPEDPGFHEVESWMPGRLVGWPSASAFAGGAWRLDAAEPVTVWGLRIHEQARPAWGISLEAAYGRGTWSATVVPAAELHWRRWTGALGVRAGALESEAGQSVEMGGAAVHPSIGAEGQVRAGLGATTFASLTCGGDRPLLGGDEPSFTNLLCTVALGWDPAEAAAAVAYRPISAADRTRRRWALCSASGLSGIAAGTLYATAWASNRRFWNLEDPLPEDEIEAWRTRTNALTWAAAGAGLATAVLGGWTVAAW